MLSAKCCGEGDEMISFQFHFILILFALQLSHALAVTRISPTDRRMARRVLNSTRKLRHSSLTFITSLPSTAYGKIEHNAQLIVLKRQCAEKGGLTVFGFYVHT